VGHFKLSSSATEKLREFQKQMGLPELNVKQDVSTRWNLCLIMIERIIEIKNSISAALSSLRRDPNCLTATEWDLIADCVPILKPFEHITSELSGEKYPTLSLVIHNKKYKTRYSCRYIATKYITMYYRCSSEAIRISRTK